MRYAIRKLKLGIVLTVSADLPLITEEFIDNVLTYYERCGKPALTVAVPLEIYESMGLRVSYIFDAGGRKLVPLGINVIDGSRIMEERIDEEIFIVDDARLAVNVNTLKDRRIAELTLHC